MSTAPALTGEELAAIPPEDRVYTCQQCGQTGTDPKQHRMVQVLSIGFVICMTCLLGKDTK